MAGAVDGLISGMSTSEVINQLLSLERQPQTQLQAKRDKVQGVVDVYQSLNSKFASVLDTAKALSTASSWRLTKGTSSDTEAVTVQTTSGALSGSLTFTVDRLATAKTLSSAGTVATTGTTVGASNLLLAKAGALGLATIRSTGGTALAVGSHSVEVTQASKGATLAGATLADTVVVGAGQRLEVSYDGGATTTTIDLTAGTYTRLELAEMVTDASGGRLTASVGANKELALATVREGSASSLKLQAANATLGLTDTTTVASGIDGVVKITNSTGASATTTVTDVRPGEATPAVLSAGTAGEQVTVSFSGGLRVGTATAKMLDTAGKSLTDVVSAINGADLGVTASAVQVSPGAYRLQLGSTTAGTAGSFAFDPAAFTGLGSLDTLSQATDASLVVGSGANAYRITSSSNSVTDVLPGVTLNLLQADPAKTVTVDVVNDAEGLADKVSKLVDAVNGALGYIKSQSAYDATTKKARTLTGDGLVRDLQQKLMTAVTGAVSASTLTSGGVGISVNRDGTLAFDRTKFLDAYRKTPTEVTKLFQENATGIADDGIAERLEVLATTATETTTGRIQVAIEGRNREISYLDTEIDGWEPRLARKEEALRRQFSGLETALGNLRNQSNWLAGQIAGLA